MKSSRLVFQNIIKPNFRLKNHISTCNKQRLLRTTANKADLQQFTTKPNFTKPKPKPNFSENGNKNNPRTSGIKTNATFKPYYLQSYLKTNPIKMHRWRERQSLITNLIKMHRLREREREYEQRTPER